MCAERGGPEGFDARTTVSASRRQECGGRVGAWRSLSAAAGACSCRGGEAGGEKRGGGAESLRLPCSAVGVSARTLPHAVCHHPRATWWLTSQSSGRWGGRVATPGRTRTMAAQGTGPARSPHLWEKECGDGSHVTWLW